MIIGEIIFYTMLAIANFSLIVGLAVYLDKKRK